MYIFKLIIGKWMVLFIGFLIIWDRRDIGEFNIMFIIDI